MNEFAVAPERVGNGSIGGHSISVATDPDYLMERLNTRIDWYDRAAARSQRYYRAGKVFVILAAAAIPLVSGLSASGLDSPGLAALVAGVLGGAIVVVEGMQQLFQWHQNWLTYRSTCEALVRERALFRTLAGEYRRERAPRALLAERTEAIIGREHTAWRQLNELSDSRRPDTAEKADAEKS